MAHKRSRVAPKATPIHIIAWLPVRYRRVKGSECGLRYLRDLVAYVILGSRETNIGTQPESSEMWSLEVSRVWHSFSALSESRLWGSNLRVDAYMHYPNSIFFIKNWIKQLNSQNYYSIFSYFMFTFTDFSVFLSLRFRAVELNYSLSPRKLEDLFNHFPKLWLYFYLWTIFIILYIWIPNPLNIYRFLLIVVVVY